MKPKEDLLKGMYFDVVFDRKIEKYMHYISAGGYEVEYKDKSYKFDFETFEGNVDDNDSKLLHCHVYNLDDSYEDSAKMNIIIMRNAIYKEFFIYTGEYDDPEIYPVRIKNLSYEFLSGKTYDVPRKLLNEVNEQLKTGEKWWTKKR